MFFRELDLGRINSLTKYPSIETYHTIGQRGRLTDEIPNPFPEGDHVLATEKVDGTNGRIIFGPDGSFLVGSREDLLYASGDLLYNPAQFIVEGLKSVFLREDDESWEGMISTLVPSEGILILYGEIFGGRIHKESRQYTKDPDLYGFRVFDAFELGPIKLGGLMAQSREQIASWRQHGGQPFMDETNLTGLASELSLEVTPRITFGGPLPTGHQEMLDLLGQLVPRTNVPLGEGGQGQAEGVVFRTPDRKVIAKARFEDYRRTLR